MKENNYICTEQDAIPMENKQKTHGGSRPGAGRKPTSSSGPRVTTSFTLSQETREIISKLKTEYGISFGKEIDKLAHRLAIVYGIIEDDIDNDV